MGKRYVVGLASVGLGDVARVGGKMLLWAGLSQGHKHTFGLLPTPILSLHRALFYAFAGPFYKYNLFCPSNGILTRA